MEVCLARKLGTADSAGVGTVVEDVCASVGIVNRFFVGFPVSIVVVVTAGAGFGCVEVAEGWYRCYGDNSLARQCGAVGDP